MSSKHIAKISIFCKNKKREFKYPAIWNESLKNLSAGSDQFEAERWLADIKKAVIARIGVCDEHCIYEIKFRNEKSNKLEEAVCFTALMNDFINPLSDKICLRLADESCDDCLIDRFGADAATGNKKRKNKKKENKKKAAKKSRIVSDDDTVSEDDDIEYLAKKHKNKSIVKYNYYSTASDEYDSDKDTKRKKKKKKAKSKPEFDAKIWGRYYNAVDKRFNKILTEQGIIEAANLFLSVANTFQRQWPFCQMLMMSGCLSMGGMSGEMIILDRILCDLYHHFCH